MAKSKKKRLREASTASAVVSPNRVESDVSAAAASPPRSPATPPPSSAPIRNGSHAASTPAKNVSGGGGGTSTTDGGNDDASTWSKSKKKRMRAKRKKGAAKKPLMDAGRGAGGDEGAKAKARTSANNSSGKKSTPDGAATAGTIKLGGVNGDGGGHSNKRQRKNPVKSSPTAAAKSVKSSEANQTEPGDWSIPENKTEKRHESSSLSDAGGTQTCASESDQKNAEELPTKSNSANGTAADGAGSSKKKRKKKKKPAAQTASTEEELRTSPEKIDQAKSETPAKATKDESSPKNNNAAKSPKTDSPRPKITLPRQSQMSSLQRAFLERLTSSRFRELNEELYTRPSGDSFEKFSENPELFDQYHVGFRKQAREWPVNPIDVIYKKIVRDYSNGHCEDKGKERRQVVIADFGCGDAKLAERLLALRLGNDNRTLVQAATKKKKSKGKEQTSSQSCESPFKVHSFDLVSGGNPLVTPADMSRVPLSGESADVGVYSLALMGTNVADFVREAWRVLKFGGVLRVAEVRSRFETAAAGKEIQSRGGKRGKLNNGKKQTKKIDRKDDGDDDAPQPLMLLDEFLSLMERCGFKSTGMDRSTNKMFLFMDFVKAEGSRGLSKKEHFTAKACIYKRR